MPSLPASCHHGLRTGRRNGGSGNTEFSARSWSTRPWHERVLPLARLETSIHRSAGEVCCDHPLEVAFPTSGCLRQGEGPDEVVELAAGCCVELVAQEGFVGLVATDGASKLPSHRWASTSAVTAELAKRSGTNRGEARCGRAAVRAAVGGGPTEGFERLNALQGELLLLTDDPVLVPTLELAQQHPQLAAVEGLGSEGAVGDLASFGEVDIGAEEEVRAIVRDFVPIVLVGGEMSGWRVTARDLNQDAGCGPDAGPGHRCQDPGKGGASTAPRRPRPPARRANLFDLLGELVALASEHDELLGQPGEDLRGGIGAGDDNGLLTQRRPDLFCDAFPDSWRELPPQTGFGRLSGAAQVRDSARGSRTACSTRSNAGCFGVSKPGSALKAWLIRPASSGEVK